MGYQLLVWEGPRPENDAAAGTACGELMRQYFVGDGFEPTPAIRAFVEASGPALFLNLRFGVGERAAFAMAEMAAERGLVTFDLYMEIMRPVPAEITDEIYRAWWADLFTMMARYDHGR